MQSPDLERVDAGMCLKDPIAIGPKNRHGEFPHQRLVLYNQDRLSSAVCRYFLSFGLRGGGRFRGHRRKEEAECGTEPDPAFHLNPSHMLLHDPKSCRKAEPCAFARAFRREEG